MGIKKTVLYSLTNSYLHPCSSPLSLHHVSAGCSCTNLLEAHVMARMGNSGDNPTASSVLDAQNSGEELSSDESDECDNTSDLEITEERSEQGATDSEQGNELTSSSSSSLPSLLSVLRAPRLSDLVRKSKTQANNPGKCKKLVLVRLLVLTQKE